MAIRERECKLCACRYEIFKMGPTREFVLNQAAEYKGQICCPCCGASEAEAHVVLPQRFEVRGSSSMSSRARTYPYFDRGLGRWVKSPSHHAELCRKMGLEPTGGETIGTWEDIAMKQQSKDEALTKKRADYVAEMEATVPEEWAKLKDHVSAQLQPQIDAKLGKGVATVVVQ